MGATFGQPGIIGSTGASGPGAWIGDFSYYTQHKRTFSGGSRYKPRPARTLSMNWGSCDLEGVDQVRLSKGLPDSAHVDFFGQPRLFGIDARDPVRGVGRMALQRGHKYRLNLSSPIVRGPPGARLVADRLNDRPHTVGRNLHTICCDTTNSPQTSLWIACRHTPNDTTPLAPAPPDFRRRASACCLFLQRVTLPIRSTPRRHRHAPFRPPTKPT